MTTRLHTPRASLLLISTVVLSISLLVICTVSWGQYVGGFRGAPGNPYSVQYGGFQMPRPTVRPNPYANPYGGGARVRQNTFGYQPTVQKPFSNVNLSPLVTSKQFARRQVMGGWGAY